MGDSQIWTDIPGYEGFYKISCSGDILSVRCSGKGSKNMESILKRRFNKKRYVTCLLSNNGVSKSYLVHRLVMLTFKGNSNLQVNHIDGNKLNNNLENLEYVTNKENIEHAKNTGLIKIGEDSKMSKIVSYYDLKGKLIGRIKGVRNLARILGLDNSDISKVCRGEKQNYKGFIFKYD